MILASGSFWGDISIIDLNNSAHIYFKSKGMKIDDQPGLDELRYNFRSMQDAQNAGEIELLLDTQDISEIM